MFTAVSAWLALAGKCLAHARRVCACTQTLAHPGCIWAVAFLADGDLVTACGDGVVRVWSSEPSRQVRPGAGCNRAARRTRWPQSAAPLSWQPPPDNVVVTSSARLCC